MVRDRNPKWSGDGVEERELVEKMQFNPLKRNLDWFGSWYYTNDNYSGRDGRGVFLRGERA